MHEIMIGSTANEQKTKQIMQKIPNCQNVGKLCILKTLKEYYSKRCSFFGFELFTLSSAFIGEGQYEIPSTIE